MHFRIDSDSVSHNSYCFLLIRSEVMAADYSKEYTIVQLQEVLVIFLWRILRQSLEDFEVNSFTLYTLTLLIIVRYG